MVIGSPIWDIYYLSSKVSWYHVITSAKVISTAGHQDNDLTSEGLRTRSTLSMKRQVSLLYLCHCGSYTYTFLTSLIETESHHTLLQS